MNQTQVETIQTNVLRRLLGDAAAVAASGITQANYIAQIKETPGEQSTQPALIVSAYFTGKTPISSILTGRTLFCQNQYNYYVSQGVADPSLGPYEALGRSFSGDPSFGPKVSGKTNQQMWAEAYLFAVGTAIGAAQTDHFDAQYEYFKNLYINAGISLPQALIQAIGAVIGQILGVGGTIENSPYDVKCETWMTNAGNGSPSYGTVL